MTVESPKPPAAPSDWGGWGVQVLCLGRPPEGKLRMPTQPRIDSRLRMKPGSIVELNLAPGYYTYARKLHGFSKFAFYDILSNSPLEDVKQLIDREILVMAPMLMPEAKKWPIIGWIQLEVYWPAMVYWDSEPEWIFDEKSQQVVVLPDAEFMLITHHNNADVCMPIDYDGARGRPRRTLYPPEIIEAVLRTHYGVTLDGQRIPPIPLHKQPLW